MPPAPRPGLAHLLRHTAGPGMIVAAAGIGASDVMAATLAGAVAGERFLWAIVLGAAAKFALADRLNRLRLAENTTFCALLRRHTGPLVMRLFAGYLVIWCVMVGASLMSGCGLAIEHLSGGLIPRTWGGLAHALIAAALSLPGHTDGAVRLMRPLVGIMLAAMCGCALATFRPDTAILTGLVPGAPDGRWTTALSVLGGIGGTVTLLAYDHERREHDAARGSAAGLRESRADLAFAYLFTALFGMAVMLVAANTFYHPGIRPTDARVIPDMAAGLSRTLGPAGGLIFSLGFWAAVCASMLGVSKTAPRIVADCFAGTGATPRAPDPAHARFALALLTLGAAPLVLFLGKPVALILAFTILGSVFIPLLAVALFLIDLRLPRDHPAKSGRAGFVVSLLIVALFLTLGGLEIGSACLKAFGHR